MKQSSSKPTRRRFLSIAALSSLPFLGSRDLVAGSEAAKPKASDSRAPEIWIPGQTKPCAIASGNGKLAVEKAFALMTGGTRPVDAAVAGVNIVENNPSDMSVGYGGLPNADGIVELDSCLMDGPTHLAGAVAALRNIKNPSKVALAVMRRTDHVLLVGEGALRFARAHGFREENLLTEKARRAWLRWREKLSATDDWVEMGENDLPIKGKETGREKTGIKEAGNKEAGNKEAGNKEAGNKEAGNKKDGDKRPKDKEEFPWDEEEGERPTGTIHLSAINSDGDMGACTTTSGLAWKIPGRVGDSPLIGCGLYTDNDYGSAGSTGRGEAAILSNGAHTAVEMMRQGKAPQDACLEVIRRIAHYTRIPRLLTADGRPNFGIKFYAINKNGEHGSASMYPSRYVVCTPEGTLRPDCAYLYDKK